MIFLIQHSVESQPPNPEFRNNPENFHPCIWGCFNHFPRHSSQKSSALSSAYVPGSYRQVCVKFKDFSRTSQILSYCFQGLNTYE